MWSNSSGCRIVLGLLDTDVMPIFMVIALDIVITLHFSINCSTVICSPTVIIPFLREASSEIYVPGSILHHISFLSTCQFMSLFPYFAIFYFPFHKPKIPKKYYFTIYPSLSDLTLRITVKGLTTPLSRWLQVGVCLCMYSVACRVVSYWIDTLVLKTEGNTYATLLHHPFLFKGKPTHAQEVARRISPGKER